MPSAATAIRLSLPWCEADADAYESAITAALAQQHIDVAARLGSARLRVALRVFPAHYSACTIMDCAEAIASAVERLTYDNDLAEVTCRFGKRNDRPRLEVVIGRA